MWAYGLDLLLGLQLQEKYYEGRHIKSHITSFLKWKSGEEGAAGDWGTMTMTFLVVQGVSSAAYWDTSFMKTSVEIKAVFSKKAKYSSSFC